MFQVRWRIPAKKTTLLETPFGFVSTVPGFHLGEDPVDMFGPFFSCT